MFEIKEMSDIYTYGIGILIIWGFIILIVKLLINSCKVKIKEGYVAIVEKNDIFNRVIKSGSSFKLPIIEKIVSKIKLSSSQFDYENKFRDIENNLINIKINLVYNIIPSKVKEYYYNIGSMNNKILLSYISNYLLSAISFINFDQFIKEKTDICESLKNHLNEKLSEYGINIKDVLLNSYTQEKNFLDNQDEMHYLSLGDEKNQEKNKAFSKEEINNSLSQLKTIIEYEIVNTLIKK